MNSLILTGVVISKGYNNKETFNFNESKTAVSFRVGYRIYDKKAPDNQRYMNITVKAYNSLCERIEKMQLKDGSHIDIRGKLDEEKWEENGQKFSRHVFIADEINYAPNDGNKSNVNGTHGNSSDSPDQNGNGQAATQQNSSENQSEMPKNFTGFNEFNNGDDNVFF